MDGWMDGWMGGGWMDGWMGGYRLLLHLVARVLWLQFVQ